MAGLWGLAFTGFPYAIALRTGNPTAVNNAFLLFFPFAFLTTAYLPQASMTGWLATATKFNPTTYLLGAMRALLQEGWAWAAIGRGLAAIAGVGAVSFSLAFAAFTRPRQAELTEWSDDSYWCRFRGEEGDEVVGGDLDVEAAAAAADEDRVEQDAGFVDDRWQRRF